MGNLFLRHKPFFSSWWAGVMIAFSLALLWPPAARGVETIALTQLEQAIAGAPPVLVAAAALEESLARLEREQAASGLQVLGGGGTGSYKEPKDESQVRDYNQAFGRLSLRYPLLGTRDQERLDILAAEARTWEQRQQMAEAHLLGLKVLREAYVRYWGSARRMALSQAFLDDRDRVINTLEERRREGFLLDADLQEFVSAFDLAERQMANDRADRKRALGIINLLMRANYVEFKCLPPLLPPICRDENRLEAAILDGHPEIVRLRGQVEHQMGVLELNPLSDIEAHADLAGFATQDYPDGQSGYGVALTFNFQMPAGIAQTVSARRRGARAALRQRQLALEQRSGELLFEAREALAKVDAAARNLVFARQRTRVALETLRENTLRRGFMPGDTIEKLQQSRFRYYEAALDLVEAEVIEKETQATMLQFVPGDCGAFETALTDWSADSVIPNDPASPEWLNWPKETSDAGADVESTVYTAPSVGLGVYVWQSAAFLEEDSDHTDLWRRVREGAIGRLLLSLDDGQIRAASRPDGEHRLRRFIEVAHRHGVAVELLLGEPTWILPGHRRDLLAVVQSLKAFAFDGLHLDMEPNQLDPALFSEEYLLAQLVRTLSAVKRVSPWPVSISLHPRYLEQDRFQYCLGCALANLDLAEVALMIYVADPDRAAARAMPIIKAYPEIVFSVAVSVESYVDGGVSWASMGRQNARTAMRQLQSALDANRLKQIILQSWSDWERMDP